MIIVKFMGGLGNQMFQYAVGRSLSIQMKQSLLFDTTFYSTQTLRTFQLPHYLIGGRTLKPNTARMLHLLLNWRRMHPRRSAILDRIAPKLALIYLIDIEKGFDARVFTACPSIYLDGYWQSEKYFSEIAQTIRSELRLKTDPDPEIIELMREISQGESVCIHIRRGDYANNPLTNAYHGLLGLDYYRNSVKYMYQHLDNPHFFVFSDDPAWATENLDIGVPTTIVNHTACLQDIEDFRLMTACRHFVIANSSFSWWAAWLCEYPKKLVVAPKLWFRDESRFTEDLLPIEWVRL